MRVKFEATDATGKVRKRSSMSHIYSHCVGSTSPRTRRASSGPWASRPAPTLNGWESEASVMPFPKVKSHELAICFNWWISRLFETLPDQRFHKAHDVPESGIGISACHVHHRTW